MVNFSTARALGPAERRQLDKLDVHHQFPIGVRREAAHLTIPPGLLTGRTLVEGQVSIDPPHAHEIDDLIKVVLEGEAFRVWISIADPSFIPAGSEIDREAARRGSSLYFPGKGFLPMLPAEVIKLGSLVKGQERLTVTLEMLISARGKELEPPKLYRSRSINAAALDYAAADAIRKNPKHELSATISASLQVSEILLKNAPSCWLSIDLARGVAIDETGRTTKLEPHEQFPTYQIVPPLMVLANSTIAELLLRSGHPALFRCHEPERGLLEHTQFVAAMNQLQQQTGQPLYRTQLIGRERAGYLAHNLSLAVTHQGLSLAAYTHYTSPLRRYPDIAVHRAVQQVLDTCLPTANEELAGVAHRCSNYPARAQIVYFALLGHRRAESNPFSLEALLDLPENEFSDLLAGVLTFPSKKVDLLLSAVRQRALRPVDLAQLVQASAHNLKIHDLVLDFLKHRQDFAYEKVLIHLNILQEWDGCTFLSPDKRGEKEPPQTKGKGRGKGRGKPRQATLFARRVMNSIAGHMLATQGLAIDYDLAAVETEATRTFLIDLVTKKLVNPDQADNKAWRAPHQAQRQRAPFINFIGNLTQLAQRQSWPEPEFQVESTGTESSPFYEATVRVKTNSSTVFTGRGSFRTEQGAKQNAAKNALDKVDRSRRTRADLAAEESANKRNLTKRLFGFLRDNPDFTKYGIYSPIEEDTGESKTMTAFVVTLAGERIEAQGLGQSNTEARANAAENLWPLLAERGLTSYQQIPRRAF
ncbi:hypothetical protein A2291_06275 [candidate division WOR-1 bacterium RIFOXYB2_FULL_42_35]|uniref:DRBM domain-containing protein n=1 Tax=candidate division WOR-1 bacterium RIFOXYC2_FULL_41_25 TaxID=1802586 RepID=A0A1F4TJD6_UNCSA|nr:MAG: hypothetical protein A2247_07795 [candidate division WOR-1 bacterium RIFOXYA2_FULL_41_14]OGC21627.1 MAG: hypothetical protein A2291_06275 [candidate division WOR-1 bacterium RIFOXYB2_FULL_42_35]OGC32630.1 MAG: hypothetical protein A2462_02035 [candidate division WOR-1 bacterium RIFOXYC2_FULL_41_25]OGC41688.1 MAG: hypothetical protein A2548_06110 [candidate division WOR-1 bacterium RIFOXYD2_FULL_41_8]